MSSDDGDFTDQDSSESDMYESDDDVEDMSEVKQASGVGDSSSPDVVDTKGRSSTQSVHRLANSCG